VENLNSQPHNSLNKTVVILSGTLSVPHKPRPLNRLVQRRISRTYLANAPHLTVVFPSGHSKPCELHQFIKRKPAVREESFAACHKSHSTPTCRPPSKGFLVAFDTMGCGAFHHFVAKPAPRNDNINAKEIDNLGCRDYSSPDAATTCPSPQRKSNEWLLRMTTVF
jgi:hypothetical protein